MGGLGHEDSVVDYFFMHKSVTGEEKKKKRNAELSSGGVCVPFNADEGA